MQAFNPGLDPGSEKGHSLDIWQNLDNIYKLDNSIVNINFLILIILLWLYKMLTSVNVGEGYTGFCTAVETFFSN